MPSFWSGGRRGAYTVAATAFSATALALLASVAAQPPPPVLPDSDRQVQPSGQHHVGPHAPPLPPSQPYGIEMEKLGLQVKVEQVGLTADGSIAMPTDPDHAGWYTGSPTPGENGNAVIVGHLDSATGPAAFYGLGALRKGDRVSVKRRDQTTATFTVTSTAVWSKNGFPSEHVYAPTAQPQLTLITCADWDEAASAYQSNLVITAHR